MTLHTSGLGPGEVYTVWWVVFNYPESCSPLPGTTVPACGADDLGDPVVQASRAPATGHVIGNNGKTNFGAWLDAHDPAGFLDSGGLYGLENPRGAEIHLVARTHGEPITDLLKEQMSTFGGGCSINVCANVQVSVHKAEP